MKEDLNKYKCSWNKKKLTMLRGQYSPTEFTDSIQSLENSNGLFCRHGKASPEIHMEMQGTQSSQNNLEKEEQSWRTHLSMSNLPQS